MSAKMTIISHYFLALRPHQWLKNFLIFIPLLTAHQIDKTTIFLTTLMFISFNFVASSVYIFNDLIDMSADKAHPRKRFRIFASGKIKSLQGKIFALIILIIGLIFGLFFVNNLFVQLLLTYFMISMLYSIYLKQIIVIDICILAILYTMRIIIGGLVLNIDLSVWLLAFSIFFFFSMAAIKRQAELVDLIKRKKLKSINRGYQTKDLPILSTSGLAAGYISVLIMAFYVNSVEVKELYSNPQLLWGICFVLLFWITKMSIVTQRGNMHDDPIIYAVKDFLSHICLLLIILFLIMGIIF